MVSYGCLMDDRKLQIYYGNRGIKCGIAATRVRPITNLTNRLISSGV